MITTDSTIMIVWFTPSRIEGLASGSVTEDGTLVKGVIEAPDLAAAENVLRGKFHVPAELVAAVPGRRRVEVAPWVLEEISSELVWPSFIVEEYPTADALEVERRRLPAS